MTSGTSASPPPDARQPRARRRRDRRGRGVRGELLRAGTGYAELDSRFGLPEPVPEGRTRQDRFRYLADAAFEQLEQRWAAELAGIDWDVDDVPPAELLPTPDAAGVTEEPVPLSRAFPATNTEPALIVFFRRPIEARSRDRLDLAELVFDILVHDLADLLGRSPEEIDPEGHGGYDEE